MWMMKLKKNGVKVIKGKLREFGQERNQAIRENLDDESKEELYKAPKKEWKHFMEIRRKVEIKILMKLKNVV